MARRCRSCRGPIQREYVFHRKIGLDNRPQIYHYVRRFTCPNGCTARLDFSKARPLLPGDRPMVLPQVKKLKKKADFNDKLLAISLAIALPLFVAAIFASPAPLGVRLGATLFLVIAAAWTYAFANQRVVLPETFPLPVPQPKPEEPAETAVQAATAAPAAAPAATAVKKKPVAAIEVPAEIPPLERAEGEPITMAVILGGEEHVIEIDEGENMLDAALSRNVEIDYSCLEGMCDTCAVQILAGANNISPPTQEEIDMLGDDVHTGLRLSCQVKVTGPVRLVQE